MNLIKIASALKQIGLGLVTLGEGFSEQKNIAPEKTLIVEGQETGTINEPTTVQQAVQEVAPTGTVTVEPPKAKRGPKPKALTDTVAPEIKAAVATVTAPIPEPDPVHPSLQELKVAAVEFSQRYGLDKFKPFLDKLEVNMLSNVKESDRAGLIKALADYTAANPLA